MVSLSPALAEMVRAFGGADTLVGRDGYDTFSDPELPIVGDLNGLDYETLLELDPTHVLIQPSAGGVPARLKELGAKHGWSIVVLPTLSLEDVRSSAAGVAGLGFSDDAPALFDAWATRWDAIDERDVPASRPLVLLGTDPPGVLGPGSAHWELLEMMGAQPLPREGGAYQTLALEDVAALDPGCLIVLAPNAPLGDALEMVGPLARLHLDAIERERIVVVREPMALIPSTSLLRTVDELEAGLRALERE